MKSSLSVLFVACCSFLVAFSANSQVNVTQHHNHANRDGLYVDPAFTLASAPNISRDTNFDGSIVGNVYAQPLYVEGGPDGRAKVIVVTESNNVYALDAVNGRPIWELNVGTPHPGRGNIVPCGITGTPVIDLASRSLFFDAVTSAPNNFIYSLNVDTGAINAGWPVNVNTAVSGFDSLIQSQRAALGILGVRVYVPYGGYFGDAGDYHGRVVGVRMNNPASVTNWATAATKAGIWGPGGIASDGTSLFVTTGNGTGGFGQQESVVRLQPGPVFSGATADYWAPTNWASLDGSDSDLGGSGPIVVDVPGATPSALVCAIGKDHNAYLLNRANLGGVSAAIASASVSSGTIIGAAATYRTSLGTYVVLRPTTGTLTAFKITATNPPTISTATGWSVSSSGRTAPFVTSSDGLSNVIVWTVGSDGRLRGYNGDTGALVFGGLGPNDLMSGVRSFTTGIVARGSIYLANDDKVYAFRLPAYTPLFKTIGHSVGAFVLSFDNVPGKSFSIYGSNNLVTPLASWILLGTATEISAGQYQFSDPTAGASSKKFYRVTSP